MAEDKDNQQPKKDRPTLLSPAVQSILALFVGIGLLFLFSSNDGVRVLCVVSIVVLAIAALLFSAAPSKLKEESKAVDTTPPSDVGDNKSSSSTETVQEKGGTIRNKVESPVQSTPTSEENVVHPIDMENTDWNEFFDI